MTAVLIGYGVGVVVTFVVVALSGNIAEERGLPASVYLKLLGIALIWPVALVALLVSWVWDAIQWS